MAKTRPTKKTSKPTTAREQPPAPRGPRMVKVRAKQDLYSRDQKYYRTGDVLHIPEDDFHEDVHEEVDARTPEKVTSSGEALQRERQETLNARAASKGLTAPIDNPTGATDVFSEQPTRGRK